MCCKLVAAEILWLGRRFSTKHSDGPLHVQTVVGNVSVASRKAPLGIVKKVDYPDTEL
jgi:hypothetical protein